MIVEPPSAGLVQVTLAWESPAVAVGAAGVTGGAAASAVTLPVWPVLGVKIRCGLSQPVAP